jgi:hypothetical protein
MRRSVQFLSVNYLPCRSLGNHQHRGPRSDGATAPLERTSSAPTVAVESHKERLAKPIKQTTVGQKKTHSNHEHQTVQKHQTVRVTGKQPTIAAGDAYGYAQEPRRIDPNLFLIFGR